MSKVNIALTGDKYEFEKDLKTMQKIQPLHPSTAQGLLVYDYKNNSDWDEYYGDNINAHNIGDYIQSIAAGQYLSSNPVYIDRDNLKNYNGVPVNMIINGWFKFYDGNLFFSDKITPIITSFHINNPEKLTFLTLDYLKRHQPIGCRDLYTKRFLESKGIEAYFSSCLTTTLDKYTAPEQERADEVIFCDYKPSFSFRKYKIYNRLKRYIKTANITTMTHDFDKNLTHDERFALADKLLRKYARAKLVVTTRIHCALPCLAVGTPVIFILNKYDNKRYEGLINFFNVIGYTQEGDFICRIHTDENGNVANPPDYKLYADRLKEFCKKIV